MPRLRYKKSYDFTLYEQEDETSNRQNNQRGGEEEEESERNSGQSWLSNAAIICQLPDAKIKQSIAALKAQISVLEAELLSRSVGNRHVRRKNWDEIGKSHRQKDETTLQSKPNRRRNSTLLQFQKVAALRHTLAKLGVANVDELLATWSKINDGEKVKG